MIPPLKYHPALKISPREIFWEKSNRYNKVFYSFVPIKSYEVCVVLSRAKVFPILKRFKSPRKVYRTPRYVGYSFSKE